MIFSASSGTTSQAMRSMTSRDNLAIAAYSDWPASCVTRSPTAEAAACVTAATAARSAPVTVGRLAAPRKPPEPGAWIAGPLAGRTAAELAGATADVRPLGQREAPIMGGRLRPGGGCGSVAGAELNEAEAE